jgi:hypothetical protein
MLLLLLAMLMIAGVDDPLPDAGGTVLGVVLNGSQAGEPIADAEVQLRVGTDGALEVVASTTTDVYGKFTFRDLPLDPTIVYLPGANRDGVHYPGTRATLDFDNRIAHVRIMAFDAVRSPSPLTAARHDIDITMDERLMKVSETLIVSNRARTTYVGEPYADGPPVSLQLSIPESFDRVTFDREFFGRRFRVVDHRVVTDLPWPPGDKELKFTYQVPLEQSAGCFRRTLDLPCSNISVRVRARDGAKPLCNLPCRSSTGDETVFALTNHELSVGYTIDLQIGNASLPWTQFARWSSVGVLCSLILGTVMVSRRRACKARIVTS